MDCAICSIHGWRGSDEVSAPLIEVENLSVRLNTSRGPAEAIRSVSFALARGETLGLVGESGCGKSITALALMGLLPDSAIVSGSIRFDGRELVGLADRDYCQLRGNRISMIFQEPMTALNPMHTIGHQVAEPLRRHAGCSAAEARAQAIALLDRVGLPDAAKRADAYPHQFSGGQRQRVTIAMALACQPDVLIADEPTTALDVTIQRQILDLIADLVAERGMSMMLISHDLGVIGENVQRMMVMYGGTVVESGATDAVFTRMGHPYTQGLFRARPRLGAKKGTRLKTIAGTVPELADLPKGCPFADRCALVEDRCRAALPEAEEVAAGHRVRCVRTDVTMADAVGVSSA
jgi:peptide/nickel transport system ATP-binding protein